MVARDKSSVRGIVFNRAEGMCEKCGGRGQSIHHRKPRGAGGTKIADVASNLLLLCGSGTTGCHGWVERNRVQALADGYLVRRVDDPALIPVLRWGIRVYLEDDGGIVQA